VSGLPASPVEARERADDLRAWLAGFRASHGRRPRVLHIGNIANNAYINAKALNAAGFDCDVICYDYYHIMGCPEWEDAAFDGHIEDQALPDWSAVDLRGFRRPRWFAQGPCLACIDYLTARREGRRLDAWLRWWRLEFERASMCRPRLAQARRVAGAAVRRVYGLSNRATRLVMRAVSLVHARFMRLLAIKWPLGLSAALSFAIVVAAAALPLLVVGLVASLVLCVMAAPLILVLPRRRRAPAALDYQHLDELSQQFARCFPDRVDRLTLDDFTPYLGVIPVWKALFENYDAVVGYATDGVLPLMCGKRPYFAYEHGTIRNIPFEPTAQGRLCALTYRMAERSLITNCDNIASAERLGLTSYCFVPHPVNEKHAGGTGHEQLRAELRRRLRADFVVFHPARQHWEARRHPDWEKGNDVLIEGFARFVEEVDPNAAAVFVEWGQTVGESKELLRSRGVADRVLWIPPQSNCRMIDYVRASDLLADQFYLGAFGSTMPKALLHGCPAMLYLDEARHRWCLPEMPPLINAREPDEVFAGMRRLYESDEFRRELIERGRGWYERYHSNEVIVATFARALSGAISPCDVPSAL
jgi:glycosyltransferase involved in cell wall biosynthesis